jgi:GH18 family chitinase
MINKPSEQKHTIHPIAYVPMWLHEDQYAQLAERLPAASIEPILAFSEPQEDGTLATPEPSPALITMLSKLSAKRTMSLAIGGWGASDESHNGMLRAWRQAGDQPEAFAATVAKTMQHLGQTTGFEVDGVDLDWEYPLATDSGRLERLVTALRQVLPKGHISMAVAASGHAGNDNLAVFDRMERQILDQIDTFNVMTYDYAGPWSEKADDIAPSYWTLRSIAAWIERVGDPAKIRAGFPTYGYTFKDALERGQRFKSATMVHYEQLAPAQIRDDEQRLTSSTYLDVNWTSCLSPRMMQAVSRQLRQDYPQLGPAFFWSIEDLTPAQLAAVA